MLKWLLIFVALAQTALAGAWPRDEDTWFLSGSTSFTWTEGSAAPSHYSGLYLERGFPRDLTVGLDAGRSSYGTTKVVVFVRRPIGATDRDIKLAWELGLGTIAGQTVVRPGLGFGYGYATKNGSGWISIDAQGEVTAKNGQVNLKLDATLGQSFRNGNKLILQVQSGIPWGNRPYARFAPSVAVDIGKGRLIEVGSHFGVLNETGMGLKIGFWKQF